MPDKKPFPLAKGERPGEIRHASFAMSRRAVTPSDYEQREFKKEGDDGRTLYEVAISSETEIQRWFGIEILSHDKKAVDMSRINGGAAVLVDHEGDQVGKVMNGTARVDDDKVMRGWIRFSRSARGKEVEADVEDETREGISVGYRILDWEHELRETGKDEKGKPIYMDVYRATRWQPMEVSIVSVPADLTVGVGRSATEPVAAPVEPEADKANKEKRTMAGDQDKDKPVVIVEDHRGESEKARDDDRAEIIRMCDAHGMIGKASEWIAQGLTSAEVARELIRAKSTPRPKPDAQDIPMRDSDRKRFSYARAVQIGLARADNDRSGKKDARFDGIEAEVHEELVLRFGAPQHGGVLVPYDIRSAEQRWRDMEATQRALDSKTVAKGAETVFDVAGPFIELLRNRTQVIALGAQVMSGLAGPVSFPKQTSAGTAFWVGENPGSDVTDADLGLGLVTLTGKSLQGSQAYSRQLLAQASVDIEGKVRNDLSKIHALAIDRACIHGLGTAAQPMGIYLTPGVNSKAHGGPVTYVNLIDQAAQVADDNADVGSLGWLTTPLLAGKLKTVAEHSTANMANWVWMGTFAEGNIGGYPARSSGQVSKVMSGTADTGGSEHGIIFGNWNDLVIGMFGAFEIVVDPYTKKKQALIEVTSYQLIDTAVLHAESFSVATGATLA